MNTFGSRLREIREINRFSISDVCARTGVSRAQISRIENGIVDPRLSTIQKLLTSYDADFSALIRPTVRISLGEIVSRARESAARLEAVGLGHSDPQARLVRKASLNVDVEAERMALASRT